MMESTPLDLRDFSKGDEHEKKVFAQAFVQSLTVSGFARVAGHDMTEARVKEMFEYAHRFFRLSAQEKAIIKNEPGPQPQRGWSCLGAENTATLFEGLSGSDKHASALKDAREHWDQGPETDTEYPNRWPASGTLPGFRDCMTAAMEEMSQVSDLLIAAIELGLSLPRGSIGGRISKAKSASEFRLNHYPAMSRDAFDKGDLSRIWPHFDLGVITLLFQDNVGGLEFEDRQRPGEFCRVAPSQPTAMIVNVSETLQRWTNDRLPAGLHRVIPPQEKLESDGKIPERFSIAYFCKADRDESVAPLEQIVAEGEKSRYSEMTAMEYHQHRLLSAY